MLKITPAENARQLAEIQRLWRAYSASLNIDLSFQDFETELAKLPLGYAPPEGCLLLAQVDESAAGCIALKKLDKGICEMNRLSVAPEFRQLGIGKILAEAVIDEARKLGYKQMRLDTLAPMIKAQRLYKSLGFKEIPAYYFNPYAGTVFMEKDL